MTKNKFKRIAKRFLVVLVTAIIMLVIGRGCMWLATPPDSETREIRGLSLMYDYEHSVSGTFILGSGRIATNDSVETKYYLYVKGDEGFRLQSIEASRVEIVETNEIEPCIKGIFARGGVFSSKDYQWNSYVAYVPEGTIFIEYKANVDRGY